MERSFNLGTLSEYALVKFSAIVKNYSKKISYEAAAIISCAVMTGYGSAVNAAKVAFGSSVVVLGCGGVGLSVIRAAKILGASSIIAIDINAQRLGMAAQFGATRTIMADKTDRGLLKAAEQVKKIFFAATSPAWIVLKLCIRLMGTWRMTSIICILGYELGTGM